MQYVYMYIEAESSADYGVRGPEHEGAPFAERSSDKVTANSAWDWASWFIVSSF